MLTALDLRILVVAARALDAHAVCEILQGVDLPAEIWRPDASDDAGSEAPELVVLTAESLADADLRERLIGRCTRRSPMHPVSVIVIGGRASGEAQRQRICAALGVEDRCRLIRRPLRRTAFIDSVVAELAELERVALSSTRNGGAVLNRRLGVGVFQVDGRLRRVVADAAAAGYLGTTPEALAACPLPEGPAAMLLPVLQQVRLQRRPATDVLTGITGQNLPVLVERDGDDLRVLVVDPERADRHLLELQAQPVIEQQVAMLRHDLSAPLRQLSLMLELLEADMESVLDDQARTTLAACRQSASRLRGLIAAGLGSMGATGDEPCDPTRAAADVRHNLLHRLEEEGATLDVGKLPSELPMPHQDLVRVLQNLVANALRYRSERTPEIAIVDLSDAASWRIAVVDNGVGIDDEVLPLLFEPYRTGPTAGSRGGTGLGLAICRQLMSRVGGEMSADSRPGAGSRFILGIPRPRAGGSGRLPAQA